MFPSILHSNMTRGTVAGGDDSADSTPYWCSCCSVDAHRAESLVQSHPPGPARDQMLATHAEEVQIVAEHLLPYIRLLLTDEEQVLSSTRLDRTRIAEALRSFGSAADIMQWLP